MARTGRHERRLSALKMHLQLVVARPSKSSPSFDSSTNTTTMMSSSSSGGSSSSNCAGGDGVSVGGVLRLAFVGCGSICHAHLNGLNALAADLIQVTACIDTSAERASELADLVGATAAGRGARPTTFKSLTEALGAGVTFDAVDIMLPHHLHRPIALEAFAAGKHVLLEKPMAPTIVEAKTILRASAKASLVFMMAENSQYWPEVVRAQELVRGGAIGKLLSGRGWHHGVHDVSGDWARRGPNGEAGASWRFDKAIMGGGVIIDGGAHWIRPLRMLLGEIEHVVGTTAHPVQDYEGESLGRALFQHANGVTSVYEASVLPPGAVLGPG
jgi:UDP-N-acetyl-2-amino-2-deoxyglucuronate dehydrogenase